MTARLTIFLIAVLLNFTAALRPALANFELVHQGSPGRLIIFVHGLRGDPKTSFSYNAAAKSWPQLMATDSAQIRDQPPLRSYSIGVLGYPASLNDKLSVVQISSNLLTELVDYGILDQYKEIYFIAHSLGGLIVKQMILNAYNSADNSLHRITPAIILLATPAQGANIANLFSRLLSGLGTPLIVDLKTLGDNTFLQSLEAQWANFLRKRRRTAKAKRLLIYCAYETKSTHGAMIVARHFMDPSCEPSLFAANEDHLSIAKPKDRNAPIYRWVRGRLASLARQQTIATQQALAAKMALDVRQEKELQRKLNSNDTIAKVQRSLSALGYQPGTADGTLGPATRAAIKAFAKDNGFSNSGNVSKELIDRLATARPRKRRIGDRDRNIAKTNNNRAPSKRSAKKEECFQFAGQYICQPAR